MSKRTSWSLSGALFAITMMAATAVFAHHGWAWAEDEQTEMTGTILEVYVGPPHPRMEIETSNEGVWQVDLGNPRQTESAGFTEESASIGDEVLVRGHRSRDSSEKLIKAVRITIDDKVYTFYPGRVQED